MSPATSRMAIALIVGIVATGSACAETVTGLPRIVDGDTVEVAGTKIRLSGIDAPETDQICFDAAGAKVTCGIAARDALQSAFGGKPWSCEITGRDRYGRALADCTADGADVQGWMVRHGHALSFVRYSHAYDSAQYLAQAAKAGIWAGCFVAPWEWRVRSKATVLLGSVCPTNAQAALLAPASAAAAPDAACTIKGNVTRKGECIFHLPGGASYGAIKMDPSKGKRWFCSEEEAEAAGCRKAMR